MRAPKGAQPLVLYVDDSPDDHQLLHAAIDGTKVSFRIESIFTYEAAVAYLKGERNYKDRELFPLPDLLLVDYTLNKRTGAELANWVRHQEELKDLPLILFSNSDDPANVTRCYQSGASCFILKVGAFKALEKVLTALDKCLMSKSRSLAVFHRLPEYRRLEISPRLSSTLGRRTGLS